MSLGVPVALRCLTHYPHLVGTSICLAFYTRFRHQSCQLCRTLSSSLSRCTCPASRLRLSAMSPATSSLGPHPGGAGFAYSALQQPSGGSPSQVSATAAFPSSETFSLALHVTSLPLSLEFYSLFLSYFVLFR